MTKRVLTVVFCFAAVCVSFLHAQDQTAYKELKQKFQSPDHARWGEVPLWWWEGEEMTRKRVTWQLEQLAEKGVEAVCPIQRAPQRARPSAFSSEWWDMMEYVHDECERLGMKLWGYDHVGYGHYPWFQKAVKKARPLETSQIKFFTKSGRAGETIRLELPEGDVIGAYGYPLVNGTAQDKNKIDVTNHIQENRLNWSPDQGNWRVAVSVAVPYNVSAGQAEARLHGAGSTSRFSADAPYNAFHLSSEATDAFLSMLYGKFERVFGQEAMGNSFQGVFQDEHPKIPRNNYTDELAEVFQETFGYEIGEAIPALHFDVGPKTPKYRTDYYDAYAQVSESTYWKRVYKWTRENGLLTSYDNWGRNSVKGQTDAYINYFRTQRWFSAPGYDDGGKGRMTNRNYYDTKIASSIARLYDQPRVWLEGFHSTGWGRPPEQTLRWLTANYAWGANLYDEHGLYYSTRARTWEHAAPDPHWRQPYWRYYQEISDWTSRLSYMMSQGSAVTDVAVHYPATSILAGEPLGDRLEGKTLRYTIHPDGQSGSFAINGTKVATFSYKKNVPLSGGVGFRSIVGRDAKVDNVHVYQVNENGSQKTLIKDNFERQSLGSNWIKESISDHGTADALRTSIKNGVLVLDHQGGKKDTWVRSKRSFSFQGQTTVFEFTLLSRAPQEHNPAIVLGTKPYQPGKTSHVLLSDVAQQSPGFNFAMIDGQWRSDQVSEQTRRANQQVPDLNMNTYMDLSRVIYDQGMDNDIIDDASIRSGTVQEGKLVVDDNAYRALVFGPEATMRRTNLQKTLELVRSGGTVLFYGQLPEASTEKGRHDQKLDRLLDQLLGTEISSPMPPSRLSKNFEQGGFCAFIPGKQKNVAELLASHIHQDVHILNGNVNYSHRQSGNSEIYLFHNLQDHPTTLHARLRTDGFPEHWNLFTGTIEPVDGFERDDGYTTIKQRLEGNTAELIVVRPGKQQNKPFTRQKPLKEQKLPNEWQFSVIPTRDNQWGSFRWPPSDRTIGPEVRSFHYREEGDQTGTDLGWHRKTVDLADWKTYRYDSGPYWLTLGPISSGGNRIRTELLKNLKKIEAGNHLTAGQKKRTWKTVVFSQKLGRRETIGDRPDGAIDPHFINLPDGHRFLFTRLRSPRKQLLGLQVKLRSKKPVLWVNGTRQPFHGTVGKLPLQQGINTVLLEIPNGGRGSLYVQSNFPENKQYKAEQAHPDLGLSADLPSPYLQPFRQHPNVRYDVKPRDEKRVGWYRFKVPPGTRKLKLPNQRGTRAWLDGKRVPVRGNEVILNQPAKHTSTMALRVSMKPGVYAGAAFPEPIRLVISEGTMTLGDWTKRGLPTYSGIGTYKRSVRLTTEQAKREIRLRLGKVRVAAEVFVNGTSAGVRVARPFRFNLTGMVIPGKNKISVHVANTLGPEYKAISPIVGPTASGLFGPVKLRFYRNE